MTKFDFKFDECGMEHIHQHTDYSLLDGYAAVEEYANRACQINQQYICVTDHGMMGAIPRQIRACEKTGRKPIFGIELYVNDSRVPPDEIKFLLPEERSLASTNYHLLAIAYNQTGYTNLVQLSSMGWLQGFYKKPRVNHEQLIAHREGIIFTSCCYNSEIGRAFDRGGPEAADVMIEKYLAMFPGHFYLEIMLLDFHKQKPYDAYIISASQRYNLPLVLTNDNHYCNKADSRQQQLMLMIRSGKTIKDVQMQVDAGEDVFEAQDTNLYMKSEGEMNAKYIEMPPQSRWREDDPYSRLAYAEIIPYELYCQAKRNTVEICRKAEGVQLDRTVKLPQIPDAEDKLKEELMIGWKKRNIPNTKEYGYRLREEYQLICRKGFASYFLIQKMIVDEARRAAPEILGWDASDFAVGPGRGSCVASLVCYCLGITNVDPIRHGLLFSRFLNEARGGRTMKTKFACQPLE